MKRAQPFKIPAGSFQRDITANELANISAILNIVYERLWYHIDLEADTRGYLRG